MFTKRAYAYWAGLGAASSQERLDCSWLVLRAVADGGCASAPSTFTIRFRRPVLLGAGKLAQRHTQPPHCENICERTQALMRIGMV